MIQASACTSDKKSEGHEGVTGCGACEPAVICSVQSLAESAHLPVAHPNTCPCRTSFIYRPVCSDGVMLPSGL